MAAIFELYLEPRYDDIELGLWCPHCLCPSGYRLPVDRITESGVTRDFLFLTKCHDCDSPIREDS